MSLGLVCLCAPLLTGKFAGNLALFLPLIRSCLRFCAACRGVSRRDGHLETGNNRETWQLVDADAALQALAGIRPEQVQSVLAESQQLAKDLDEAAKQYSAIQRLVQQVIVELRSVQITPRQLLRLVYCGAGHASQLDRQERRQRPEASTQGQGSVQPVAVRLPPFGHAEIPAPNLECPAPCGRHPRQPTPALGISPRNDAPWGSEASAPRMPVARRRPPVTPPSRRTSVTPTAMTETIAGWRARAVPAKSRGGKSIDGSQNSGGLPHPMQMELHLAMVLLLAGPV